MAWSQADVDTLKAAIAQGIRRVSYSDRTVEYGSIEEMRQALQMVQGEVSQTATTPRPRAWYGTSAGKGW